MPVEFSDVKRCKNKRNPLPDESLRDLAKAISRLTDGEGIRTREWDGPARVFDRKRLSASVLEYAEWRGPEWRIMYWQETEPGFVLIQWMKRPPAKWIEDAINNKEGGVK